MKTRITLSASVLAGIMTAWVARPVLADGAADRAALATCVEQHFTPADGGTMANLTVMTLLDAQPDNTFHTVVADKREAVISDVAKLLTRLVEDDCKPQFVAVNAVVAPGVLFRALMQHLSTLGMRSLQGEEAQRSSAVLGIDLIKKLDSKVMVDLLGTTGTTAAAPTSVAPKRTHAPAETSL